MKKLLITLFISMSIYANAQENLTYSKVIKTDSVGKAAIFVAINDWFAVNYNSANDVIQMADKEAGTIIGKGVFDYSHKGLSYLCYSGWVKYTIRVDIKDNRYKVELTNFIHSNKPGNAPECSLGLITNKEDYSTTGLSKDFHNNVWKDIKQISELKANEIFNSLENKTKNLKKVNNDW